MRISAKHRQYDVAAVVDADDNDEDNHNLSPTIHRNLSTLIPTNNCQVATVWRRSLCASTKIWEKWSLETSFVGMATHTTFSGKQCLWTYSNQNILNINQIPILWILYLSFSKHFQKNKPQQIIVTVTPSWLVNHSCPLLCPPRDPWKHRPKVVWSWLHDCDPQPNQSSWCFKCWVGWLRAEPGWWS